MSSSGHPFLEEAIKRGNVEAVRGILEELKKNNPNLELLRLDIPAHGIHTAHCNILHFAVYHGQLPIITLLVNDFRFYPTTQCQSLGSPLHIACWRGHLNVVKHLLSIQAVVRQNLNEWVLSYGNETPLRWACRDDSNLEIVKELLKAGADIWNRDGTGNAANGLDIAAQTGSSTIFAYLLPLYLNPASPDEKVIASAIQSTFTRAVQTIRPQILEKMFLNKNCSDLLSSIINSPISGAWTALHVLARKSSSRRNRDDPDTQSTLSDEEWIKNLITCVETLLKYGADPNIKTSTGMKPIDFAKTFGEPGVMTLLEKAENQKTEDPARVEREVEKKEEKKVIENTEDKWKKQVDTILEMGFTGNRTMIGDLFELYSGNTDSVLNHLLQM